VGGAAREQRRSVGRREIEKKVTDGFKSFIFGGQGSAAENNPSCRKSFAVLLCKGIGEGVFLLYCVSYPRETDLFFYRTRRGSYNGFS
jgi:hypothetical protein